MKNATTNELFTRLNELRNIAGLKSLKSNKMAKRLIIKKIKHLEADMNVTITETKIENPELIHEHNETLFDYAVFVENDLPVSANCEELTSRPIIVIIVPDTPVTFTMKDIAYKTGIDQKSIRRKLRKLRDNGETLPPTEIEGRWVFNIRYTLEIIKKII